MSDDATQAIPTTQGPELEFRQVGVTEGDNHEMLAGWTPWEPLSLDGDGYSGGLSAFYGTTFQVRVKPSPFTPGLYRLKGDERNGAAWYEAAPWLTGAGQPEDHWERVEVKAAS